MAQVALPGEGRDHVRATGYGNTVPRRGTPLDYPQDVELINRLSPPERLALIGQLWESLDQDDLPLTPAQQSELELRLASLDVDRLKAVSWTDLKAELEQLCP